MPKGLSRSCRRRFPAGVSGVVLTAAGFLPDRGENWKRFTYCSLMGLVFYFDRKLLLVPIVTHICVFCYDSVTFRLMCLESSLSGM